MNKMRFKMYFAECLFLVLANRCVRFANRLIENCDQGLQDMFID